MKKTNSKPVPEVPGTIGTEGNRSDLAFLAVFGLFFCVWNIGAGSLASYDEAFYAQVAKEMAATGDWVHMKTMGQDWYSKPPLAMWATALFYKIFGVGEFAARLFSALCGTGAVLLTYLIGRRLFGRTTAFVGAGVLLSSTDYLHFSRWGQLDIPNLFFFTLAILCFLKAAERPVWHLGFWSACAAAFMTKGPVIALVFAVLAAYSAWRRDFKFLKSGYFWGGAALGVLLAAPWHAAVYLHNPKAFVNDFIGQHWLSRTGSAIEGHAASWYFYVRTLINKYHPWVVLLPLALPLLIRRASKGHDGAKLLTAWFLVVFGVFTFVVQTKLRWYILPMYPAISLACGALLARFFEGKKIVRAKAGIALALILHIPFSSVMLLDYSSGIKELAPVVNEKAAKGETLYFYQYHEGPAATFYYDRTIAYNDTGDELDATLAASPGALFILKKEAYEAEKGFFDSRKLAVLARSTGQKDNVVLLSARPR